MYVRVMCYKMRNKTVVFGYVKIGFFIKCRPREVGKAVFFFAFPGIFLIKFALFTSFQKANFSPIVYSIIRVPLF